MPRSRSTFYLIEAIENHRTFYASLLSSYFPAVCGIDGDWTVERTTQPTWETYRAVLSCVALRRKLHLVVEEFTTFRFLLFIAVVSPLAPGLRYSLCVHNVHSWIYLNVHRGTLRIIFDRLLKVLVVKGAERVIVVNEDVANYFRSLLPMKKVLCVPFRRQEAVEKSSHSEGIPSFCIPGNVEEVRRDYVSVLTAFKALLGNGARAKITLLGVLARERLSHELLSLIDDLSIDYPGSIQTFDAHVDEVLFDRLVSSSVALICNVRPLYVRGKDVEIYGISKETGIRVLADHYRKVCLMPRLLPPGTRSENYLSYADAGELEHRMAAVLLES